jgi:hypothetical protein
MNGPSFFSRRDVSQDDPPLARLARGHLLLLRLLPCLALGAAWFTFMYKKHRAKHRLDSAQCEPPSASLSPSDQRIRSF